MFLQETSTKVKRIHLRSGMYYGPIKKGFQRKVGVTGETGTVTKELLWSG